MVDNNNNNDNEFIPIPINTIDTLIQEGWHNATVISVVTEKPEPADKDDIYKIIVTYKIDDTDFLYTYAVNFKTFNRHHTLYDHFSKITGIEPVAGLDLRLLKGKTCRIFVVHRQDTTGSWAEVTAVEPSPAFRKPSGYRPALAELLPNEKAWRKRDIHVQTKKVRERLRQGKED